MRLKRLAILLVVVLGLSAGGLAFAASNAAPAPQDILTHAVTTLHALQDGHAILQIDGTASGQSQSATVELWGKKLSDGNPPSYAFRVQVQQTSDARAMGAAAMSDGTTVWLYAPSQNKVWTGPVSQMQNGSGLPLDSPAALVQQLLTYATVTLVATEPVQGHSAYKLQFVPISGKTPAAAAGVTGLAWIDTARSLPLQASIDAGSMGHGTVTATLVEVNIGVPDSTFQFQPPAGATIVPLRSQLPQHLTLSDADAAAGFHVLQPAAVPAGATLVDVTTLGGAIVLHYETASGSFAVAENISTESNVALGSGQQVPLRGTAGTLFTNAAGNQALVVWTENGRTYSVGGAISGQDALNVAGSLQ
jgi:outer membrane lipoprotein-sorting protein